jgi:hypothetical protein
MGESHAPSSQTRHSRSDAERVEAGFQAAINLGKLLSHLLGRPITCPRPRAKIHEWIFRYYVEPRTGKQGVYIERQAPGMRAPFRSPLFTWNQQQNVNSG